jgi:hypothetical protein
VVEYSTSIRELQKAPRMIPVPATVLNDQSAAIYEPQ